MCDQQLKQWFALRVTYGRELKFQALLDDAGYETFVPMVIKRVERGGKQEKKLAPAVSNLCFVRSEQETLHDFFHSLGDTCPARFIWDKATRLPVVISDKAMRDFITISKAMVDDTVYLSEVSQKLREGQEVVVMEGPFAGIQGRVVRIRRSRRVMVELPGMMAVATTYIPLHFLKPVSNDDK